MHDTRNQLAHQRQLFHLCDLIAQDDELAFESTLFLNFAMQPRTFQRESDMDGNSGEKLTVCRSERLKAIQQLQNADSRAFTIHDRHAENIFCSIAEASIEVGIEAR